MEKYFIIHSEGTDTRKEQIANYLLRNPRMGLDEVPEGVWLDEDDTIFLIVED